MIEPLKKQTKTKADVIVDFGTWNANMADCTIFANSEDGGPLIVLLQDKDHPERRVQITLTKETQVEASEVTQETPEAPFPAAEPK
jgi:hypothetical protein